MLERITGPSCMGSPERTTRVFVEATALIAVSASGSAACPASSMKMCVKWPLGMPMLYAKDALPHVVTMTLYVFRVSTDGKEKWPLR